MDLEEAVLSLSLDANIRHNKTSQAELEGAEALRRRDAPEYRRSLQIETRVARHGDDSSGSRMKSS